MKRERALKRVAEYRASTEIDGEDVLISAGSRGLGVGLAGKAKRIGGLLVDVAISVGTAVAQADDVSGAAEERIPKNSAGRFSFRWRRTSRGQSCGTQGGGRSMKGRAYRPIVITALLTALVAALLVIHGPKTVLVVTLVVGCAYLNAMFLAAPLNALRQRKARNVVIAVSALVVNMAVLFFTGFSVLAAVVVWMPALAGLIAAALLRR